MISSTGHILNNSISDNIAFGIMWAGGNNPILIQGNLIQNNGHTSTSSLGLGGGIRCEGVSVKIIGNHIIANKARIGGGIYIQNGSRENCDALIVNNLIADNIAEERKSDTSNGMGGSVFISCSGFNEKIHFINNTIVNNRSHKNAGIYLKKYSHPLDESQLTPYFLNNIIYYNHSDETDEQIYIASDDVLPEFYFNNVENGISGIHKENNQDNFVYLKNLEILPLFADTANKDYSLLPNSPCINRGYHDTTGLNLPLTDLNNLERIQYGIIDIGAFEADTFCNLPSKPERLYGNMWMCMDPGIKEYHTNYQEAYTYYWSIYPKNAGTIVNQDSTLSVKWSESYTGKAYITVQAENDCGKGKKSNPLEVFINDVPVISILGDTLQCTDAEGTTYEVSDKNTANNYYWSIYPQKAGNIVLLEDDKVLAIWSKNYRGETYIKAKGTNYCGAGPYDSLKVRFLDKPGIPDKPRGDEFTDFTDLYSVYTTNRVINANTYQWILEPSEAGNITGYDTFAIVNWNEPHPDYAYVKVKAGNSCGFSESSDSLTVNKSIPLRIEQNVQGSNEAMLYPVPVKNHLFIKAEQMIESITFYNDLGQWRASQHINATKANINMSTFNVGFYIIKIQYGDKCSYHRIIKQ